MLTYVNRIRCVTVTRVSQCYCYSNVVYQCPLSHGKFYIWNNIHQQSNSHHKTSAYVTRDRRTVAIVRSRCAIGRSLLRIAIATIDRRRYYYLTQSCCATYRCTK